MILATATNCATLLANSGLSLTTPSSRIVKSAGCNAFSRKKASTALSTFGRSGSSISKTKAGERTYRVLATAQAIFLFGNQKSWYIGPVAE